MGIYEGLQTEKYDRQYRDRDLLKRITPYLRPEISRIVFSSLLVLVTAGVGAALPYTVSRSMDWISTNNSPVGVLIIPIFVLALNLTYWLANWQRRRLTVRAVNNVVLQLRSDIFNSCMRHDLSFYDQYSSGRIVSRISSDTQDFSQLISMVSDFIAMITETIIIGVILVIIESRLALYLFAVIPIVFIFSLGFRRWARSVTKKGMAATASVNAAIKETISGIAIAKNFRQEPAIYQEFNAANRKSYTVNLERGLVLNTVFPALNALSGAVLALMVYLGGMSVAAGAVTIGGWTLFILSMDRFLFPIMDLASFWPQIQNGLSAAERVFALMDAAPAVKQSGQDSRPELHGEIELKNVGFSYQEKDSVLDDFSLRIRPGENIALVGHTGAGKSSIARLIARFYEFQKGQILIDGTDIRDLDLSFFRRQLGIVSQSPFLFDGTVEENLRYGDHPVSENEILAVCNKIGQGVWLEALPHGIQTPVGERGSRLSMGQRQLVALVRVLVQKPRIFILDEATASIDPFTERQIQQALNLILKQSTSILIAHRLSTVKSADRIIVIEKGHILEEGNHESLLDRKGHYAELYNTYFRHQSLEYAEKSRTLFAGS